MARAEVRSATGSVRTPLEGLEAGTEVITAAAASARLHNGSASSTEIVRSTIERISSIDRTLHSFITVAAERALAEAEAADREIAAGHRRSALHGVPFAVKDNYDTESVPTTAASRVRLQSVPDRDAALVAKLRSAGAILLGKLATWEYGTGNGGEYFDLPFPPARNPWDLRRFTGGSSTGAGAAVAAGLTPIALGSDTTGSVRLPAAATATVGLVPTAGRLATDGMLPNTFSLDRPGIVTWTVEDCALVASALLDDTGVDFSAVCGQSVRGMRVAVVRTPGHGLPEPDAPLAEALEVGLAVLSELGVHTEEVDLPVAASECFEITRIIGPAETAALHEQELREAPSALGFALRDKLLAGSTIRAVDYIAALRRRAVVAEALSELIERYDALITYGALHMPPLLGVEPEMTRFTVDTMLTPFNLSGHPALVQCNGSTPDGLPTHWQLVAKQDDEASLIRLANAYEMATDWRARRPTIDVGERQPTRGATQSQLAAEIPSHELAQSRAYAARVGLGALSDADLVRLSSIRTSQEETGAALPRVADKRVRPFDDVRRPRPAPPQDYQI